MWMLNAWQVAAFADEVGEALLPRRLCDMPVVLYRQANGVPVAMEDRCPHRLLPLSAGRRVGDDVQCGYHGVRFGPDGACTGIPGQDLIPAKAQVRTFPLAERYKLLWIWLGEPSVADPALVPDCHWMDSPGWVPSTGYHHMEGNYRLVTDNLLDLSHESYIHEATIGNDQSESIANFPVRTTFEGGPGFKGEAGEGRRLVRAHREMPSIKPPPMFRPMVGDAERIDRWQSAVYMPPGIHMTNVGVYPTGTPREHAAMQRVLHLLTPETDTTTHYFWAVCRNFQLGDPAVTERLRQAVMHTFNEDKHIIGLQQKAIGDCPDRPVPNFALKVDAAPMAGRRMLKQFIEREGADPRAVAPPVPLATDEAIPLPVAAE